MPGGDLDRLRADLRAMAQPRWPCLPATGRSCARVSTSTGHAVDKRILLLALASFATGTEAHVYAGHLAALAEALDVPIARAGQLAAAFAVTYALAAPPVAGAVAALDRRRLILAGLVAGLVALGALNLAAMAAPSFGALLAVRVPCGLAACLVAWVRSPPPPSRRSRPRSTAGAPWPPCSPG